MDKIEDDPNFEVIMGSFDGMKICELVGVCILNVGGNYGKEMVSVYREDGLACFKTISAPKT